MMKDQTQNFTHAKYVLYTPLSFGASWLCSKITPGGLRLGPAPITTPKQLASEPAFHAVSVNMVVCIRGTARKSQSHQCGLLFSTGSNTDCFQEMCSMLNCARWRARVPHGSASLIPADYFTPTQGAPEGWKYVSSFIWINILEEWMILSHPTGFIYN